MQPIDIRPDHLRLVLDILQHHVPMAEVWAFGSRAKWLARDTSDLDLCLRDAAPLSFEQMGLLREAFEESNLPYKVDVVDWATISASFRKVVEHDKVLVQEAKTGRVMAGEWRETTLGTVLELKRGYDLPQQRRSKGRVPLVSSSGVTDYHSEAMVKGPGVVTGRYGTLGQVFYVQEDFWPLNTTLYVRDFKGNDPRFISYFLRSLDFQAYSDKGAVPGLNRNHLHQAEVKVPTDVDEQRAIAHILGTLDDKIELNRRMNETLEAIARAIFKSWFVDFDPVRAKASGEAPESICRRLGLTPDLLSLFPDRLVDSELGEIPEGWEVKPLDEIADYLNGLALQKFPPENDSEWLPVIKISQLKKGDSVGADRASHKLKPEYIVDDGDVLFSWSGSLEVDIWCGGRGALNQHLFKVTSTNYPKWFYFYWTKYHLSHFQAIAAGKAVTMGHIQRKHLTEALCAVPQTPLLERLDGIIAPLLDIQIENRKTSRTLAMVRDAFLPKLLSGELRVPVAGAA